MININQLKPEDVGRWVFYHAHHGTIEEGRIKAWGETLIFVVYKCDNNWDDYQNYTAAGTKPEDLTWKEI